MTSLSLALTDWQYILYFSLTGRPSRKFIIYFCPYYIIDNDVNLAGLLTARTILDQDFGPLSADLYLNLNISTVKVLFTVGRLEAR